MDAHNLAQNLVQMLAAAIDAGALSTGGAITAPGFEPAWAELRRRLQGDRTAEATLTLFEGDARSADLQRRLAASLEARLSAGELRALITALRGDTAPPQVRSHISADEDALIQGSGHKVIAPGGAVDLETSAGKRGRIIDSPISIIGAGVPLAGATAAPAPTRGSLPPTLSADGVHFTYGHALLVGVGAYENPRLSVPSDTTANDARALTALLCDPRRAAYPNDQVRLLLDAAATRARILEELETLAQRLAGAPGSTALIFFAGHGEPCGASYALLPYDTDLANLAETTVTAELFHRAVAKVRAQARRLVVLLNCCHAGGVGDAVLGESDGLSGEAPPPEFYRPLALGSGQVVVSSSRPGQKSGASSMHTPQHTTFGARLLAALRGEAPGQDPGIGVFELFSYLRLHVPADAAAIQYHGAPLVQEPLFYASQLDDNIAVALRAPGTLGTLGSAESAIGRLVELEMQIELQNGAAAAELIAERDALLAHLAAQGEAQ